LSGCDKIFGSKKNHSARSRQGDMPQCEEQSLTIVLSETSLCRNNNVLDTLCGSDYWHQEVGMKRFVIAAAIAASAVIGVVSTASAQGVEVDVGRGGVRVGERHHGWDRWHRAYGYDRGYERGCRVIVTRHINRFGERVVERRRVCR
jgi:hypothetical protein